MMSMKMPRKGIISSLSDCFDFLKQIVLYVVGVKKDNMTCRNTNIYVFSSGARRVQGVFKVDAVKFKLGTQILIIFGQYIHLENNNNNFFCNNNSCHYIITIECNNNFNLSYSNMRTIV